MYVYHLSAKKEKKEEGSRVFEKDVHAVGKKGFEPEKREGEKEDCCSLNPQPTTHNQQPY